MKTVSKKAIGPRVIIVMTDEMMKEVEAYRRDADGPIPSRSEAIRQLLDAALDAWRSTKRKGRG